MVRYKRAEDAYRRSAAPTGFDTACPIMGRKAFLAALYWLTLTETLGEPSTVNSLVVKENTSAQSAPRLYRNVPVGVYASAAPHGAYSFQVPAFFTTPKAAASRLIPVTEVIQNTGYLKDSYGNRFVEPPQSFAYKTTFPQQFVQLQDLPAHLAQPLVAAAPSFQYKNPTPFVIGSHYTLPLQAAAPQHSFGISQPPPSYGQNIRSLVPHHNQGHGHSTAQQQPTSNKAVYSNIHPQDQYNRLKNEPKFQRLQEAPREIRIIRDDAESSEQVTDVEKPQSQAASAKRTAVTTVVNGQKSVINLKTQPPLPLLDLKLLEPLTFDNPLVPQVQHFLPRINEATYHKLPKPNINGGKNYQKEFVVQKTKSYDSGNIKGKSRNNAPKKKPSSEYDPPRQKEVPVVPTITVKGTPTLNQSPEFSYEINSPNYKETYKEQAVSYNKETQSEPVHYTYGTKTKSDPVQYRYAHTSKEPVEIKEIHYQSNGQDPKQLIYKFKPEEQNIEQNKSLQDPPQESSSEENSDSEEEGPVTHQPAEYHKLHEEAPNTHQLRLEHREEEYHHTPNEAHHKVLQHNPPQYYPQPLQVSVQSAVPFHPITQNEENIRFITTPKTAHIKVDPTQHIQRGQSVPELQPHPSSEPQHHSQPPSAPQNHPINNQNSYPKPHHALPQHIQEKSRRVIIQEETPEEMHSLREQASGEMIDQEENNEEDFENAYKNAAFGFPAFEKVPGDAEKDIYNPENYGVPRYHSDYNIEHTPFQQYQEEGDDFPKTTRSNYKDMRDKTKENYFLDYSISRPESLTDRYSNKVDYYKLFMKQKPERYVTHEQDKKEQKQNSKYTVGPYVFSSVQEKKPKQTFAQYKASPHVYEYDYSKEAPRDNSAYASRPLQRYKSKTYFVEPQFQYGFEPISIPQLLDSELAAMASNHSPESEKPGMRKKVYKENWYIKKTSTSGAEPTS